MSLGKRWLNVSDRAKSPSDERGAKVREDLCSMWRSVQLFPACVVWLEYECHKDLSQIDDGAI